MEQAILNVAQVFTGEIYKLEGRKAGSTPTITLTVKMYGRYSSDAGKIKLELSCNFANGDSYETVKAADLGTLMDEVYRRAGFADREAIKIDAVEASLVALPAPDPVDLNDYGRPIDDEIPF